MFRRLLLLIGLFTVTIHASAQLDTNDYYWDLTNVVFSYPASWDEPYAVQRFGIESLLLAESDVRNPERPPEVPFIVLTTQANDGTDPTIILQDRIAELNIVPAITIRTQVMDQDAIWTQGYSQDGTFFGIGITITHGDNYLSIIGRVPSEQSAQFEYIIDVLTRSMTQEADFALPVPFGIVWDNSADSSDNGTAFLNISSIALDEANQSLYTVDDEVGLLRFDLLSGRLEEIITNDDFIAPETIAIGIDNTIFVSDPDCSCIHVYQNGAWQDVLDGFQIGAPLTIRTTPDGTLYATDGDDELIELRQYNIDGTQNTITDTQLDEQPYLMLMDGQLTVMLPTDGVILQFDGNNFTPLTTLETDYIPQFAEVAPDGTLVISDGETLDLYTMDSLLIDSLDILDYSFGSRIQGLKVGSDSALYIAAVDNEVGEVLAISQRVPAFSFGLPMLQPYRISGSFLDENNTHDIWLFEGESGDTISLYVQGFSALGDFQFEVSLFAPDGTEIVTVSENTDTLQSLDRSIPDYILPDNGIYEVHINRVQSDGNYEVTLIDVEPLILAEDITTAWGELSESYGQEMWSFEASAGTTLTITIEADNSTLLDPYAILYDAQYTIVAQNNDAEDLQLGNTAQINAVTLQRNGVYYIDALRIDGDGRYKLTIEVIEN